MAAFDFREIADMARIPHKLKEIEIEGKVLDMKLEYQSVLLEQVRPDPLVLNGNKCRQLYETLSGSAATGMELKDVIDWLKKNGQEGHPAVKAIGI